MQNMSNRSHFGFCCFTTAQAPVTLFNASVISALAGILQGASSSVCDLFHAVIRTRDPNGRGWRIRLLDCRQVCMSRCSVSASCRLVM